MGDLVVRDAGGAEPNTHAFVVKVWREDGGSVARRAVWRGYITHVVSGHRRYVTRLSQFDLFIALYLQDMCVKLPLFWRICQWLSR